MSECEHSRICNDNAPWQHIYNGDNETVCYDCATPMTVLPTDQAKHNEEAARLLRWLVTTKMPVFLLCAEADSFVAWENTDSALRGVVE